MVLMTEAMREQLETLAREGAAQHDPSHAIVANLRSYCSDHVIDPSDSELFVIAEDAIARQMMPASNPAEHEQTGLAPRSLKDRRRREQRHGPRRMSDRRRTGLLAIVLDLQHLGGPEHRTGRDRRAGGDRRVVMRRKRVRRQDNR